MNMFPIMPAIEACINVMAIGNESERVQAEAWRQERDTITDGPGSTGDRNRALVALLNKIQPIADGVERARRER